MIHIWFGWLSSHDLGEDPQKGCKEQWEIWKSLAVSMDLHDGWVSVGKSSKNSADFPASHVGLLEKSGGDLVSFHIRFWNRFSSSFCGPTLSVGFNVNMIQVMGIGGPMMSEWESHHFFRPGPRVLGSQVPVRRGPPLCRPAVKIWIQMTMS